MIIPPSHEEAFKNYVLDRAKKDNPNMPDDAELVIHWPTKEDPRFWVDILSDEYCKKTDNSTYDEPPNGDPIVDQYILVSNELLQNECPRFFNKHDLYGNGVIERSD